MKDIGDVHFFQTYFGFLSHLAPSADVEYTRLRKTFIAIGVNERYGLSD